MFFVFAAAAFIAGLFAALVGVVFPIAATVENMRRARRGDRSHVSLTPLIGTIFGTFAVLSAPVGSIGARAKWAWMPLAIEVAVYLACGAAFAKLR